MPETIEELDSLIERLAMNAEMGAVSHQLMRERQVMQSDPERLAEVRQQIRALKEAEHPVVRLVSPVGPVKHKVTWRRWADVPESGKLSMLQDLVDWTGISNKDMAHILLGELDVGKLTAGQRDFLIRLAEPVPVPERQGKKTLDDLRRDGEGKRQGMPRSRGRER